MAFREASTAKIGGKFLIFGDTNSGKSWFTLTMPRVGAIDSETGLAHYENRSIEINGKKYKNLVFVDNTSDLDTLEEDIESLLDGDFDGKIETLSIDSETKFYNTMQVGATEVEERRARKNGGDVDDSVVSSRQWGRIKIINMKMQQAKIDLSARGIHIVSVAQATDERDKKDTDKIIGEKPDMHKSVKFDYDTILRFYTETDKKTGEVKYFAEVLKDRTNATNRGQIIENCTFDIWADYYNQMNGLSTIKTSYSKDLKTSTDSMMNQAEQADELVAQFKKIMKEIKDVEYQKKVNKKIKELELDVKNLAISDVKKLQELVEFTEALTF